MPPRPSAPVLCLAPCDPVAQLTLLAPLDPFLTLGHHPPPPAPPTGMPPMTVPAARPCWAGWVKTWFASWMSLPQQTTAMQHPLLPQQLPPLQVLPLLPTSRPPRRHRLSVAPPQPTARRRRRRRRGNAVPPRLLWRRSIRLPRHRLQAPLLPHPSWQSQSGGPAAARRHLRRRPHAPASAQPSPAALAERAALSAMHNALPAVQRHTFDL